MISRPPLPLRLLTLAMLASPLVAGAGAFDDWRYHHSIPVAGAGFIEIEIPTQALDAGREDAGDLRLADADGNEIPYIRVSAESGRFIDAPGFEPTLTPDKTRLRIRTPGDRPVDAVLLVSPADRFLKAVTVEASDDGASWSPLAQGAPIFREASGAGQMRISFGATIAKLIQLTIDDSRSQPIPISGARLHLVPDSPAETEPIEAKVLERVETPGRTRFELDFGDANLALASIGIESDNPLFIRKISLLAPEITGAEIREKRLDGGAVFRVAIDGAAPRSQLDVAIDVRSPARQLILEVENGDSPPLEIRGVRASRRLERLRFLADAVGECSLFVGNPNARSPNYDLSAIARGLQAAKVSRVVVGPRMENPAFSTAAQLPQIPLVGAALDTDSWEYRKPVAIGTAGVQQLELDPQVLSHTGTRGADWRIIRDGIQVPFIVQRPSIDRPLTPVVSEAPDPQRPTLSRWEIELPYVGLPASTLVCRTEAPLFNRRAVLVEEVRDRNGQIVDRTLGSAQWLRDSETDGAELKLNLAQRPQTDHLILEVENGDNSEIGLSEFRLFYPAVRLLFKTADTAALDLYYGNPNSVPPKYDLSLAAAQLLRAAPAPAPATLGDEEALEAAAAGPHRIGGNPGAVFWVVLVAVVGGLLFLIAKLLPRDGGSQS